MSVRTVPVMTAGGAVVELTREQCQAQRLDGSRCPEHDFRGADSLVLCWTHRQAITLREMVLVGPCGHAAHASTVAP